MAEKERTNVYLLSIVGIVAIVGIVILLLQSSQQSVVLNDGDIAGEALAASATLCTDTDHGIEYTVPGKMKGGTWYTNGKSYGTKTDSCTDSDTLKEYYCSDNTHGAYQTISCRDKIGTSCSEGACIENCNDVTIYNLDASDFITDPIIEKIEDAIKPYKLTMMFKDGQTSKFQNLYLRTTGSEEEEYTSFYDIFIEPLEERYPDQTFTVTVTKEVNNLKLDPNFEPVDHFDITENGAELYLPLEGDITLDVSVDGSSTSRYIKTDFTLEMNDPGLHIIYNFDNDNFNKDFFKWSESDEMGITFTGSADLATITAKSGGSGFSSNVDDDIFGYLYEETSYSDTRVDPYIGNLDIKLWDAGEYNEISEALADAMTAYVTVAAALSGQELPGTRDDIKISELSISGGDDFTFKFCRK